MPITSPLIVSVDVESYGLPGGAFSIGAVVVDMDTKEVLDRLYVGVEPGDLASIPAEDAEFLRTHVLPHHKPRHMMPNARSMRNAFWTFWCYWADQGAMMLVDCGWPVEANLLTACINDDTEGRKRKGPYPMLDVGTSAWLTGMTQDRERLPDEQPKHNPVADALASARQFIEHVQHVRGASMKPTGVKDPTDEMVMPPSLGRIVEICQVGKEDYPSPGIITRVSTDYMVYVKVVNGETLFLSMVPDSRGLFWRWPRHQSPVKVADLTEQQRRNLGLAETES